MDIKYLMHAYSSRQVDEKFRKVKFRNTFTFISNIDRAPYLGLCLYVLQRPSKIRIDLFTSFVHAYSSNQAPDKSGK